MVFTLNFYISRTVQPLRVNGPSLLNTLYDEFFVTKLSPYADNRLVPPITVIFSRAPAKAERDLSSLYGMFLYVELGDPGVYTPQCSNSDHRA